MTLKPITPQRVKGWVLDVYPAELGKVAVWVISEAGKRIRFTDFYQPCIYVSAKQSDLDGLITKICNNTKIASLQFTQKYAHPNDSEKSRVLELTIKDCRQIPALELEILRLGDYLRYEIHNCDKHYDRSYFFSHDLFPLAYIEVEVGKNGLTYTLMDEVERIDYVVPKLRVMRLIVDIAKKALIPNFEDPIAQIRFQIDDEEIRIDYGDEATKLLQLSYAMKEFDPDVVVTSSGDAYLLPYLAKRAQLNEVYDEFTLSRDNKPLNRRAVAGRTYFSYGHTFYRAGTMRLLEEFT